MALAAGARLGPYVIKHLVGSGGMGEVYCAHDARLDRDVAVKVLPQMLSTDADRLRRFEQEARAAAALNHPNILAVYDVGTHEGAPYVVSELLQGRTLRQALSSGAPAWHPPNQPATSAFASTNDAATTTSASREPLGARIARFFHVKPADQATPAH